MQVLIAGAGIGGLTAALSLHQAGIPVGIVEAAPECKPLGVGINLLPAAVSELTRLGLGPGLAAIGVPVAAMAHFDRHGNLIWREPRAGQYSVHRGDLQMLLLNTVWRRLGPAAVRFACTVEDFTASPLGATVTCRDETSGQPVALHADALIGADGLHSAVRRHLHPAEGPPVPSGITMWRGISQGGPFFAGGTVAVYGCNSQTKLVVYPISPPGAASACLNWVAEVRGPVPPSSRPLPAIRAELIAHFADWSLPGLDLAGLFTAAPEILQLPMTDRDPLSQWGRGPVTLLGDAAHPMYPVGSNGGSQAILDAGPLTTALTTAPTPTAALRAYERDRLPAANSIAAACRSMPADEILTLVASRAPNGFCDIKNVLTPAELAALTAAYRNTSHPEPALSQL
jgi:2-polyprenyl-6-methoxyphenol hydroxylase-like FAD-dependent oxidoreductase